MEAKVRLIADVKPEIKQKLIDIKNVSGNTMTEILTSLIEKEHKKVVKK